MSPTPRAGFLLGLVALSALVIPGWLAIAAAVAVVAATATDAFMVRQVPRLQVQLAPVLSRGIASPLIIEADQNTTQFLLRQPAGPDLRIEPQEGESGLEAVVIARRRGRHLLPAPATRATGPLGLGWWFHRTGTEREVVVYPDMPAARRLALEVRLGRLRGDGRRARGPLGLGTELESIREYSPDDDIRQVNWLATARVGHPMSNTYRIEQDREVYCLLDCGRLMAAPLPEAHGKPGLTRLDAAVDVVAAMASVADEVGDRIGVLAFNHKVLRHLSPRRDGAEAVINAIFDLEPGGDDSDYQLAFQTVAHAKRAFVLILTDLLDQSAARPLLDAMGVLGRHHSVVVASTTDPTVEEALALPVPTIAGVLRQSVAVDVIEAREQVAARIGAMGGQVVEAPPERLSAACVGAYLSAKKRARL